MKKTIVALGVFVVSRYETAWKDGKTQSTHKIVWEAHNGPILYGMVINHKDGNKWNNNLSNLEVVTQSENVLHAYRTGLQKRKYDVNIVMKVMYLRDQCGFTFTQIGSNLNMTRQYAWQLYNRKWGNSYVQT